MAVEYEPCKRGYHRVGTWCEKDGNPRKRYPAKRKPKPKQTPGPIPNPTPTPIPNPTPGSGTTTTTAQEPFSGTITPAVAQGGDTGTSEAPGGGDMTGTSAIVSEMGSVFGSGPAATPQYNYSPAVQQTETTAQQTTTQPVGP